MSFCLIPRSRRIPPSEFRCLRRPKGALELEVLSLVATYAGGGRRREQRPKHWGCGKGPTENAAACKELLADLIERGLNLNRALLVVIDGVKALHKAVLETFGARVLIDRHAHKKRNVMDALPERTRASVCSAMNRPTPRATQTRSSPARESCAPFGVRTSRRGGLCVANY